jgi:hypothetical protein
MSENFNNDAELDATLDQLVKDEPEAQEEPKVEEPVVEEPKAEEPKPEPSFISAVSTPAPDAEGKDALGYVANGVIGVSKVTPKAPAKKKASAAKKEVSYVVAERSVFWSGVGNLNKGFNVVAKDVEDKWLSRDGVRKATQDEIDKEHGN